MKIVLQKVTSATVTVVDGDLSNQIGSGYVLLVGGADEDRPEDLDYLANKISKLRIFTDQAGKMNLSIQDVGGSILSISQFTLFADTKKGNRPSFTKAGEPIKAKKDYELFNDKLRDLGLVVVAGEFGAHMQIELINDGPTTILFDTAN